MLAAATTDAHPPSRAALPTVSVLVPVFDGRRFLREALLSALGQSYPAELVDVVVVDDGSSDGSAEEAEGVAAEHPDRRIRVVRQANTGNVGAVNRAIAEADGRLLAMLDADDRWPPGKLAAQVEVLARRPEVGLVYTDMRVIDADGAVVQESWLVGTTPPQGRCFGALLPENPVTASSVMLPAAMAERVGAIPAEIAWADWWLALAVAQVAPIAYLPEPRTDYRFHGENMSLGTQGPQRLRELRRAVAFQRWHLRRLAPGMAEVGEIAEAWAAFERNAMEALHLGGSPFSGDVPVTAEERARARLIASGPLQVVADDPEAAIPDLVRAAATDPWYAEARDALIAALGAASRTSPPSA